MVSYFSQDLYTVMIKGPEKTPYEDGLFFFDFQLSSDYPEVRFENSLLKLSNT